MEIKLLQIGQFPEFFRDATCIKRVQLPRSLMELSTGAEPTLELILRRVEVGQIDKFTEFLGQLACQKQ